MNESNKLIQIITRIVNQVLAKQGVLQGQWHLGVVESVISTKQLSVYIDGSTVPQKVSANPSVTFSNGDHIWVVFINGNPLDKFAISKRAV